MIPEDLPAVFGTTSALSCKYINKGTMRGTIKQSGMLSNFLSRVAADSAYLKGHTAKVLAVSGNVKVHRGVFVGSRGSAAVQASGRKRHRTEFYPIR